jgi:hypothetical protein
MPSVSRAQHNLFGLVYSNPAAARRLGISRTVAHDFLKADKGKHFPKEHVKPKAKTAADGK